MEKIKERINRRHFDDIYLRVDNENQEVQHRDTDLLPQFPCLQPIHDSYIDPARHENLLGEVIVEAYRKIMCGFTPVVEKEF